LAEGEYTHFVLVCASNRQSIIVDDLNRARNSNGSVFEEFTELIKEIQRRCLGENLDILCSLFGITTSNFEAEIYPRNGEFLPQHDAPHDALKGIMFPTLVLATIDHIHQTIGDFDINMCFMDDMGTYLKICADIFEKTPCLLPHGVSILFKSYASDANGGYMGWAYEEDIAEIQEYEDIIVIGNSDLIISAEYFWQYMSRHGDLRKDPDSFHNYSSEVVSTIITSHFDYC